MDADDIVLVEGEPSMRLISPPSVESLPTTMSETSSTLRDAARCGASTPLYQTTPYGCNPCGLAFRPKSTVPPFPNIPNSTPNMQHCCHGSFHRNSQHTWPSLDESPVKGEIPPPPSIAQMDISNKYPGNYPKSAKPFSPSPFSVSFTKYLYGLNLMPSAVPCTSRKLD